MATSLTQFDLDEASRKLVAGDYAEALNVFLLALEQHGDNHVIHAKVASCYAGLNEFEKAHTHCNWAISNNPGNGDSHYVMGAILGGLYDWEGSVRESKVAINFCPQHPSAHWNLSLFSFGLGDYETAFANYKYGKVAGIRPIRNLIPSGTPEDWRGKVLHIWCEQGHGDVFMLARYIRYVREEYKPKQIILEVYPELIPAFFNHQYADVVYRRPDNGYLPYPDVDYSASLWDVACLVGKITETFQDDVSISDELTPQVEEFVSSFVTNGQAKVGVCWKGNGSHVNDVNRSATVEDFVVPLKGVDSVILFSFQHGEETTHADVNFGMELANWGLTIGYLLQMDLLITVDTGIAHLAGVLGIPTIVVCPFSNEWRWGYNPDKQLWKSDWYGAQLRVCRQTVRKDWTSVMPLVRSELEKFASWHKTIPHGQPIPKS